MARLSTRHTECKPIKFTADMREKKYQKLYKVFSYLAVVYLLNMLYFKMSCVQCCQLSCAYCCSCLVSIVVVVCALLQLSCMYCCSCRVCIVQLFCVCCCSCRVCIVVVVLCVLLSSYVYLLYCVCIAVFSFVLQMPDCWLEVSTRKVLRPATSTQVFLGFPVSISKC